MSIDNELDPEPTVRMGFSADEALTTPRIFVTVGTDHHPFDRVVRWADSWAADHPEARVLIQFGSAAPPRTAAGQATLPAAELKSHLGAADAVVTQGGPAGIIDCRSTGRLPIVVPRLSSLGEHVDDHQVAFSRHLAAQGRIALAVDEIAFRALLERALAHPEEFRVTPETPPTQGTVAAIDAAISRLLIHRPRRATRPRT